MPSTWTLHRSAADSKLAGVSGGVAERWGLDPVLVRVGFVLLALVGGVGAVLYLAGWLLLPVAGTDRAVVDDLFGGTAARWPRELWITLVVLACIVSFTVFAAFSPFGVAPALVLLAVWWFGFRRSRIHRSGACTSSSSTTGPTPYAVSPTQPVAPPSWTGPQTPFTQAAAAWQARVQEVRQEVWDLPTWSAAVPTAPVPPVAPAPPTAPAPPAPPVAPTPPAMPVETVLPGAGPTTVALQPDPAPVPEEELARAAFLAEPDPVGLYAEPAPVPAVRPGRTLAARRLRLVTVTALGLTWLGLGVADALGAAVSAAVYAGAGLLVLALGLVAATRFGRARGLLPAAVVLAVAALAASSFLGVATSGPGRHVGRLIEHPVTYTSAAALPAAGDRLDLGDLQVDLTGLTLTGDATYRARVDTGRLLVRTPSGVGVKLHYDVGTGDVQAYGTQVGSGSELRGDRVVVPPAAGQPTLTLDLTVDTGELEVRS